MTEFIKRYKGEKFMEMLLMLRLGEKQKESRTDVGAFVRHLHRSRTP